MKTIHDILKLGDPRLYQTCEPVLESELDQVPEWTQQLHEAMVDIRRVWLLELVSSWIRVCLY